MLDKQIFINYRKHKRFKVRDGVFAVFGKDSSAIGQIVDISMAGFAFNYGRNGIKPSGLSEVSLLLSDKKISPHHASFKFKAKVIENREMNGDRPFNHRKRLCALKFDDLTYYQAQYLDNLIADHSEVVD